MSNQEQTNQSRLHRAGLIWQFLKGSRWFFLLCMLCAAVSTLADMVTPQIIRVTVDQVLGSAPADQLSPLVRSLLEAAGGVGRIRDQLWIVAAAVIFLAGIIGSLFVLLSPKRSVVTIKQDGKTLMTPAEVYAATVNSVMPLTKNPFSAAAR